MRVGDAVTISENVVPRMDLPNATNDAIFTVVGFVEFWPGFMPLTRYRLDTGELIERTAHLAVLNMGYASMRWGVRPYEIWFSTKTDSGAFLNQFISDNRLPTARFTDNSASLALGIFGVMGAMVLLLLAVLVLYISKIKIDQALKLGED